jgi:hypothetical protein
MVILRSNGSLGMSRQTLQHSKGQKGRERRRTLTEYIKTEVTQLGERSSVSTANSDMGFIAFKSISMFLIRVSQFPLSCCVEHVTKSDSKAE